jgi:hypothetical protein
VTSRDPTRSAGLRRHGRTLVNRRIFSLHQRLRQGFQDHDVVGLRTSEHPTATRNTFINWMESVSHKLARAEGMLQDQIEATVLMPLDWPRELMEKAVEHGIMLVEQELRTSLEHVDFSEVSRLQAGAATVEIRGIASETERRLLRLVVLALETKQKPETLMREVRQVLEKVTRLRLHLMINTGVVRAVNAGKLFAYEYEGIEQVGVDPEWIPASRQHDHAPGHHHRPGALFLDAPRTRKAKVRARVKANKARRERRGKRSIEEEILVEGLEGLAGAGVGELAVEMLQRIEATAEEMVEEEEEASTKLFNVLTAGDDRVCQNCQDIAEDGPYEIDEARGLIPAHPNCRCAFVPWGDKRFASIQEQEEEWE